MAVSAAMLDLVRKNKAKYTNNNVTIKKISEGKTRLRILPVPVKSPIVEDATQFWLEYGSHWIKDAGGKVVAVVGSSEIVYNKPSPVATMVEKAITGAATDEDLEHFKEMKATKKVLVNALCRTPGASDASEDPAVYELSPGTWGKVWAVAEQYLEEGVWIFDVDNGIDIVIERTGKGKQNTDYSVQAAPTLRGSHNPVPKEAMDKATDLFGFVEKELFNPVKETKALAALTEMTGIAAPALPGPRSASTAGLLTSAKPVEPDPAERLAAERVKREAEEAELKRLATDAEAAGVAAEAEVDDDEAKLMAQLEEMRKKKVAAAAKAGKAAASKPAPAPATAPDNYGAELTPEEMMEAIGDI